MKLPVLCYFAHRWHYSPARTTRCCRRCGTFHFVRTIGLGWSR